MRGISATLLALIMGLWILAHQHELLHAPGGAPLYNLVGGHVGWLAWPILVGGIFGVLGLFTRYQILSVISCVLGIVWFGWISAFLWYSNFTNAPNIAAILCLYAFLEYVYRFVLLAIPVAPGEEYGAGW